MEATNGQGYAAQLCVPDCRSRLAEAQTFSQMAYNGHCLPKAAHLAACGKL